MLFSHTKNNHHHLITELWEMPMSLALELEFAIVTDVPFAVTILKKRNTHKLPEVCQIEILWKKSHFQHTRWRGVRDLQQYFPSAPVALTALQLSSARASLPVLPAFCRSLSVFPSTQGFHDRSLMAERSWFHHTLTELPLCNAFTGHAWSAFGEPPRDVAPARLQLWSHQAV